MQESDELTLFPTSKENERIILKTIKEKKKVIDKKKLTRSIEI
jgi:hypothetical protein